MLRGKMELILSVYGLPKETVTAIMMIYKNTGETIRIPDVDCDFFDILVGVFPSSDETHGLKAKWELH